MTPELSFRHRFQPASASGRPPLLLLHGTGGDENDLLPLGPLLAPGAALLSPRGKVLEGAMPRFFRRLAEGVLDEVDVRFRANELADFVSAARTAYGIDAPIAVGYSNGANVAAAVLLLRPEILAGAVLFRPMPPLTDPPRPDLAGRPILMLSGATDPLAPASVSERLVADLRATGAAVDHRVIAAGHGLTQQDVTTARAWLDEAGA